MNLSKAVKILMIKKGLSAVDVSKKTGLSRSTIFRTVGDASNPTIENADAIAKALGTTLSELIIDAEKLDKEGE